MIIEETLNAEILDLALFEISYKNDPFYSELADKPTKGIKFEYDDANLIYKEILKSAKKAHFTTDEDYELFQMLIFSGEDKKVFKTTVYLVRITGSSIFIEYSDEWYELSGKVREQFVAIKKL